MYIDIYVYRYMYIYICIYIYINRYKLIKCIINIYIYIHTYYVIVLSNFMVSHGIFHFSELKGPPFSGKATSLEATCKHLHSQLYQL